MYLSNLVSTLVQSDHFALHDDHGNQMPLDQLRREYASIKTSLLGKYAEGDRVGILLPKDYRYLLVILACIEVGLTYIPLNTAFPEERIQQISRLAHMTEIIDQKKWSEFLTNDASPDVKSLSMAPEKPLYIIFTSGSTGEPKGVVISRRSCENFFQWVQDYFQEIDSSTRLLQVADFSFDMSVLDVGLLLTKQVKVYFTAFDGNVFKLAHEIQQYHISLISTVPNNFNMLLSPGVVERVELGSLRNIFIGGARFSYGLYQKMTDYFDPRCTAIYNFYGPTEVTVYATVNRLAYQETEDAHDHNISIGKAIDNVEVKILDINGSEAMSGELILGGVQVMSEYVSNPSKTSEAIISLDGMRYYRTGDLAFQDNGGKCYITGRMNETIKRRGYRIDLLDIDSYIHKIEYVSDCTSIAVADEKYENLVITYIILKSQEATVDVLKTEMKKLLTDYQMPDKVLFIEEFPLNPSGKICKKTLLEMYSSRD